MLVKYLEVVFFLFVFGFLLFIDQPKALESKDGEKQRQLPKLQTRICGKDVRLQRAIARLTFLSLFFA